MKGDHGNVVVLSLPLVAHEEILVVLLQLDEVRLWATSFFRVLSEVCSTLLSKFVLRVVICSAGCLVVLAAKPERCQKFNGEIVNRPKYKFYLIRVCCKFGSK